VIGRSLRWRIASAYAALLLAVVVAIGVVLTFELRTILLGEAHAKVDNVVDDIARLVRGDSGLAVVGDAGALQAELLGTGVLDHWAGPTTFVELDAPGNAVAAKSTNMGGAALGPPPASGRGYRIEDRPEFGRLLVRTARLQLPTATYALEVGESLAIYDETIRRIRELLIVTVAVAILIATIGSFAVARSALEPIARLAAAMRDTSAERLTRRIGGLERRDELGALASSFDDMLDRLEAGFERERQFISDASHELRTPLTVINANAQMLERWADREPEIRAESLRAIVTESAALTALVAGMLVLSRAESGEAIALEPVDLAATLGAVVEATRARADARGIALELAVPAAPAVLVSGDRGLLRQLFTNLVDNALKFSEHGTVVVTLEVPGESASVRVEDEGPGIEPGALAHVFDRFFRADASRDRRVAGTGLGLAIVHSIARIHGGTVTAENRRAGGAAFLVELPTLTDPQ